MRRSSLRATRQVKQIGSLAVVAVTLLVLTGSGAEAQTGDLALPTSVPGRHVGLVRRMTALGQFGVLENHAPGPVDIRETVTLGIRPDGTPAPVEVRQRVVLAGTGDFILEVPMDAADAAPVATDLGRPGLRQGTIIWEGFANQHRKLAASVTLRGRAATARFPIAVSRSTRDHNVTLTLTNATGITVPVATGDADPQALAAALGATRAAVQAGEDPLVSHGAIPATIAARASTGSTPIEVTVPVHVVGTVTIGHVTHHVDQVLTRPAASGESIVMTGRGSVHAELSVELVGAGLGDVPSDDAATLTALEALLARSLRKADYDPFIPGVAATTSARFAIAPAPASLVSGHAGGQQADVALAIATLAGILVLVGGAARWWARH